MRSFLSYIQSTRRMAASLGCSLKALLYLQLTSEKFKPHWTKNRCNTWFVAANSSVSFSKIVNEARHAHKSMPFHLETGWNRGLPACLTNTNWDYCCKSVWKLRPRKVICKGLWVDTSSQLRSFSAGATRPCPICPKRWQSADPMVPAHGFLFKTITVAYQWTSH